VVAITTVDRQLKRKVCVANGKEVMRSGGEICLLCLPLALLKPNQFTDNNNIFHLGPHRTTVCSCFVYSVALFEVLYFVCAHLMFESTMKDVR
jgi:hypothetical protein